MRTVRGVSLALLVLVAAAWPAQPPAASGRQAEPAPVWEATAAARGVQLTFNTEPRVVPVDELVHFEVPEASSAWSTTVATARASTIYPGTSGTGGPRLLCDFGLPCPEGFPPPYPMTAAAQHPAHPDAETRDGLARAHAGADGVWSAAFVADGDGPLAALAPVVSIDAANTRTTQEIRDGTLRVTAHTELEDVRLLDGMVRIASLSVRSTSRAGSRDPGSDAAVELVGLSVAGSAASISEDGIVVPDEARAPLDEALARTGTQIRLVGSNEGADGAGTFGDAAGLVVTTTAELAGPALPVPASPFRAYRVTVHLGHASTAAFTTEVGGLAEPPPSEDAGIAPGSAPGTGTRAPDAEAALPAPGPGQKEPGSRAVPTIAPQARTAASEPRPLGGLVASRLRVLYGVGGIAGLLVFAASRAAPALVTRDRMVRT